MGLTSHDANESHPAGQRLPPYLHYCVALSQLLMAQVLPSETEKTLTDLLAELAGHFAAELSAPRWVRTENGIKEIGERGA